MGLTQTQVDNGKRALGAVQHRAHIRRWGRFRARRVARMVIMCCLTESNLWVYANRNIAASMALPHDQVGTDHASVGMFQQQVPSWGTVADCMDPYRSCFKFLDGLASRGYDGLSGPPLAERIQAVQVSAPGEPDVHPRDGLGDGGNYQAHARAAWEFIGAYWDTAARSVRQNG